MAGAALHQTTCGNWETGVTAELSRAVVVAIFQGDPAKPGSASPDAAHGQFAIMQGLAPSPQAAPGVGDEAFSVTSAGGVRLVVRAGDLVVTVEGVSPPNSQAMGLDTAAGIIRAVLAHV